MRIILKLITRSIKKSIILSNRFNNLYPIRFFTTNSSKDLTSKFSTNTSSDNSISKPQRGQTGQTSESGGMSEQIQGSIAKTEFQERSESLIENLIIQDHITIKDVYDKFNSAQSREEAEMWRNEFVYELARHSIAEEITLYPLIRSYFPDGETIFQTSINEHHKVKEDLYMAQHADPYSDNFRSKVKNVMDDLIKHIQKEENEILPMLKKYINQDLRTKAGKAFLLKKSIVPTRPHTMVPEDPVTINNILGLLISPIDKFRDLFTNFPDQHKKSQIIKESSNKTSSSPTNKN